MCTKIGKVSKTKGWRSLWASTILLRVLLLVSCLGGVTTIAQAQCTLVCKKTSFDHPFELAVDQNCGAVIVPDLILESPESCPGDKTITVLSEQNQQIAIGMNELQVDLSDYIGEYIQIRIQNSATGQSCTSVAWVMDNIPPVLVCEDVVINCGADTSVASVGMPDILDNCGILRVVNYEDKVIKAECIEDYAVLIERYWYAEDGSGNAGSCIQRIFLERPGLENIQFPPENVIVYCDDPDTSPDNVGRPIVDRDRELSFISKPEFCGISMGFQDDTTFTCHGVGLTIVRTWRVVVNCTSETETFEQIIQVKDTTSPTIICPADQVVKTNTGTCYATLTLPKPNIFDNCDPDPTFVVTTSWGDAGVGPHRFVPVGTHTITYMALDACGNTQMCTMQLEVVDGEEPTAVCDDQLQVSLTTGGVAFLYAEDLDEGSYDNCAKNLYFKARRMETGACDRINGDDSPQSGYQEWFDDKVILCCEDIDASPIQVLLRVYQISPGQGPVDPDRETGDGDLAGQFNECWANVVVEDKLPPSMRCPDPETVDCTEDLSDLSIFGDPVVADNCSFTLEETPEFNLDKCGTGTIRRFFKATDPSGNSNQCTQTITVINGDTLVENDIIWPLDYTTSQCGASVDPKNLPAGFNKPVIIGGGCSDIAISREDQVFKISYPACYKIFRYWAVVDWCSYDENDPASSLFEHVQVIKVEDRNAPVLECPDVVTADLTEGCESTFVDMDPISAGDCDPNLIIESDSPFALEGGADASGNYPLGSTIVTFTASDGCGNTSECEVRIDVIDKKPPVPVCISGLSVSLARMNGDIMAMLHAETFNGKTVDNCDDPDEIEFTIRKGVGGSPQTPPTATQIAFTCDELGRQSVEVWARDKAGNYDFCTTYVEIQDNSNLCPDQSPATALIAGDIATEDGKDVESVQVEIRAGDTYEAMTGVDGYFEMGDIPTGRDIVIVPRKMDEPVNGVSTFDLILISKHILGIQRLTSPFQLIAADVDGNGNITTLDLIRLRKLILNQDQSFSNGNHPWRFIDANFNFPEGENPLKVDYPEFILRENFIEDEFQSNFVAVKVGDINGSVVPNSLLAGQARSTDGELILKTEDRAFKAGETFNVTILGTALQKVVGFQFTLDFEERLLEFVSLDRGPIPGLGDDSFGVDAEEDGNVIISWDNDQAGLNGEEELFTLTFRALQDGDLFHALKLDDQPALSEAYGKEGGLLQVLLTFEGKDLLDGGEFQLYPSYPNPFEQQTLISFLLPKGEDVLLQVFDPAGREVYRHQARFSAGYNEWPVKRQDLKVNGMYYYRLRAGEYTGTGKMVLGGVQP